jgi:hypothetical protein
MKRSLLILTVFIALIGAAFAVTKDVSIEGTLNVTGTADVSGNVAIGKTNPLQTLDVYGNIGVGTTEGGTVVGSKELVLREDGDVYGSSIMHLRNRNGENGAIYESTDPTTTLIDFIFKTADVSGQRNIRLEARAASARTGDPSFHIGGGGGSTADPDNPSLSVGDSYCAVAKKLSIGTYNIFSTVLGVSGDANIIGTMTATTFAGDGANLTHLGVLSGITVLTTASSSPYTVPTGVTDIEVTLIGGGGGGAGGTATTNGSAAAGGGGGGGACTIKRIATSPGTTYTFSVGTGGAGGSTAVGTNGGQTQFNTAAITANGGTGGTNMATGTTILTAAGGAGGTAGATGDLNIPGCAGGAGYRMSATLGISGTGGSSFYGSQSASVYVPVAQGTVTGTAGVLYGSGGAGGVAMRTAATQTATGGAGANGVIIIHEYK